MPMPALEYTVHYMEHYIVHYITHYIVHAHAGLLGFPAEAQPCVVGEDAVHEDHREIDHAARRAQQPHAPRQRQ